MERPRNRETDKERERENVARMMERGQERESN